MTKAGFGSGSDLTYDVARALQTPPRRLHGSEPAAGGCRFADRAAQRPLPAPDTLVRVASSDATIEAPTIIAMTGSETVTGTLPTRSP